MLLCAECENMALLSCFKEHMLTPEDFLEHSSTENSEIPFQQSSPPPPRSLKMLLLKDCFNISALIYLPSPIPHNCLVMFHPAFPTFHQSYQLRLQLHFQQRFAQRAPNFSCAPHAHSTHAARSPGAGGLLL